MMRTAVSALALAAAWLVPAATTHAAEIDTEHLFAFTIGSDIGDPGDREIEGESSGRFGKRRGSYTATSHALEIEYVPMTDLRLSAGPSVTFHDIHGVEGFDDRRQWTFQGLSFDARYRFVDRNGGRVGFAVDIEPHWARTDESSGAPVDQYGADLALVFDHEFVPNQVLAALNLLWQPDTSRSRATGDWSSESTLGVSTAVMARIAPGIFLGGEARYLRKYDGVGFDRFSGQAFFLGPTLFANLSERAWIAVGWSAQVAGRSVDDPAALDLTNFERHHVRVNFGVNF
jgi:hypothetical protein